MNIKQADPSELVDELKSRGYKPMVEESWAQEHEYTTTQRMVSYGQAWAVPARHTGTTAPGAGPAVVYPARGEGEPWELLDTCNQQLGENVLWVWTWFRCGKQHPDPQETFEEAWNRRLAAGGITNEVMESFAKVGWDLARGTSK